MKNMKRTLCVLTVMCCLTSMQVYAHNNDYTNKYLIKSVKEQRTDNITDEYLDSLIGFYFNLFNNKDYFKALDSLNYALERKKEFYGPNSVEVAKTYLDRACFYHYIGNPTLEKEDLDKAYNLYLKNPGDISLKLKLMQNYAEFYAFNEQASEAIKYLDKITEYNKLSTKELADLNYAYASYYEKEYDIAKAQKHLKKYYDKSILAGLDKSEIEYNYQDFSSEIYRNLSNRSKMENSIVGMEKLLDNFKDGNYDYKLFNFNLKKANLYMLSGITEETKNFIKWNNYLVSQIKNDNVKIAQKYAEVDYYSLTRNFSKAKSTLNEIKKLDGYVHGSISYRYIMRNEKLLDMYKNYAKDYDNAEKVAQDILNRLEEHKCVVPATYAKYLKNMGAIKKEQKKYDEAKTYYDNALSYFKNCKCENSYDVASVYYRYSDLFKTIGKNDEAIKYAQKAIKIFSTIDGNNNKDSADTYQILAETYANMGQYKTALTYMDKCISIYKNLYGDNNIAVYDKLIALYNIYNQSGKYEEAKTLINMIKEDIKYNVIEGEFIDRKVNVYIACAYNEINNWNYDEALRIAKEISKMNIVGDEIDNYNSLMFNLYSGMGNTSKAKKYRKE